MIYEDFNRPHIIRFVENIVHRFSSKEHTLGLMQVKTDKLISDKESVKIGIRKISEKHLELIEDYNNKKAERDQEREERKHKLYVDTGITIPETSFQEEESDWGITRELIKNYNPDNEYINEISELSEILIKLYYSDKRTNLFQ